MAMAAARPRGRHLDLRRAVVRFRGPDRGVQSAGDPRARGGRRRRGPIGEMVNAHERRFRSVRRAYYFLQGVAAEAGSRLSGNGEVPFAREFHNSELAFWFGRERSWLVTGYRCKWRPSENLGGTIQG